ncbi:DUF4424 family protein [Bartonella sp. HY038]|uniref:DUF4424 family protein n=1 Tax=Bartonella sp. HY038 TaxID=2759660 RepID=UPI0015FC0EBF|nr:DUF4424 family protein [Bartonella sp. HY038]
MVVNDKRSFSAILGLLVSFFTIFIASPSYSFANDSSAEAIGGGLVLLKRQDIAMVSEDLYISQSKIEVNYIFENLTNRDITTLVAFPTPELPVEMDMDIGNNSIPDANPNGREVNFRVWVEGKEIAVKEDKRVIQSDENYGYSGDDYHITYYWQQTFPKGKKIHVRHTYSPIVGGSGFYSPLDAYTMAIDDKELYCPDGGFKKALQRKQEQYRFAYYNTLGYILTTGANWAGGTIGDFRLVVDKGSPDALVTFCGENVKKISPTQFEMRAQNYQPTHNIGVIIVNGFYNMDED